MTCESQSPNRSWCGSLTMATDRAASLSMRQLVPAALILLSAAPSVRAECYYSCVFIKSLDVPQTRLTDLTLFSDGDRYCRMDTSTRVGIGFAVCTSHIPPHLSTKSNISTRPIPTVAIIFLSILAFSYSRRRRLQRANMAYVHQQQAAAATQNSAYGGYGASPYGAGNPQFPAQAHQTGAGYQPSYYAPPAGPPPAQGHGDVEYPPPPMYSNYPSPQIDHKAPV